MVDLFDYRVIVTIEAKSKEDLTFEEFLTTIRAALSNQRTAGKIDGSKLTVDKKFASKDWHDGLE